MAFDREPTGPTRPHKTQRQAAAAGEKINERGHSGASKEFGSFSRTTAFLSTILIDCTPELGLALAMSQLRV
jgi:hypothetical protein